MSEKCCAASPLAGAGAIYEVGIMSVYETAFRAVSCVYLAVRRRLEVLVLGVEILDVKEESVRAKYRRRRVRIACCMCQFSLRIRILFGRYHRSGIWSGELWTAQSRVRKSVRKCASQKRTSSQSPHPPSPLLVLLAPDDAQAAQHPHLSAPPRAARAPWVVVVVVVVVDAMA